MELYLVVEKTLSKKVHPTQIHGIFVVLDEAKSFADLHSGRYNSSILVVRARGTLKEILLLQKTKSIRRDLIQTSCI